MNMEIQRLRDLALKAKASGEAPSSSHVEFLSEIDADSVIGLINQLEAAERQRHDSSRAWRDKFQSMHERAMAAERREQALAAYVERIRELWDELNDWNHGDIDGASDQMHETLADAPAASLARRDALNQVAALQAIFDQWKIRATVPEILGCIEFKIQCLRRQAEADNHDHR